ncbi:YifB family Mg chelatase-like AAA ATPase [Rickettsiales bacterium LUAb2]
MTSHSLTVVFLGVKAIPIEVQVHIANGLPALNIVGLVDKSISESKERIRAAFSSLGIILPPKRITVNLSPSDLIKEGSHFDLPIALAILHAMEIIPNINLKNYVTLGEISLNGDINSAHGVLPALVLAVNNKKDLIFPKNQLNEVSLFNNRLRLLPITNLQDIINHFQQTTLIKAPIINIDKSNTTSANYVDMKDIKGQEVAKRALEIAAAGSHNLLMIGHPGIGKSMLANAIQGILPPLTKKEMLEVSVIYSIAGMLQDNYLITNRPFRSPHHTSSEISLIGGGKKVTPGEITLAHKGILFLDELAEFHSHTLNSLREPLEAGHVNIARINNRITFPSDFQLIAAMNPCKCGYLGDSLKQCSKAPLCSENYQSKISGPLLDRIDITIELNELDLYKIDNAPNEPSKTIYERVIKAREIQNNRYKNQTYSSNAKMDNDFINEINNYINKQPKIKNLLLNFAKKYKISMRSYNRILRIAQTICDLDNDTLIKEEHIAEAISYRKINYSNLVKHENF